MIPISCWIFLLVISYSQSATITNSVMDQILTCVNSNLFNSSSPSRGQIRKILRLAFHDCNGGVCDGSINFANQAHRGLVDITNLIYQAYNSSKNNCSTLYQQYMSRADFFVFVYLRAFAQGLNASSSNFPYDQNNTNYYTYYYGRSDDPTYTYNNDPVQGAFPAGTANWTDSTQNGHAATVMETLGTFLSQTDIVALLGLHGTGSAISQNEGFQGGWGSKIGLNNVTNRLYQYILGLIGPGFKQQVAPQNPSNSTFTYDSSTIQPDLQVQWQGTAKTTGNDTGIFMLNVDMAMYLNFTSNSTGYTNTTYCSQNSTSPKNGSPSCNNTNLSSTMFSRNANLIYSYATNSTLYIQDVTNAFLRLTNMTNSTLNPTLTKFVPIPSCDYINEIYSCSGDIFNTNCQSAC